MAQAELGRAFDQLLLERGPVALMERIERAPRPRPAHHDVATAHQEQIEVVVHATQHEAERRQVCVGRAHVEQQQRLAARALRRLEQRAIRAAVQNRATNVTLGFDDPGVARFIVWRNGTSPVAESTLKTATKKKPKSPKKK